MPWPQFRAGRFLRRRGRVSIQLHFGSFLLLFPGFIGVLDRLFDDPLEQPIASGRVAESPLHQIAKPHPLAEQLLGAITGHPPTAWRTGQIDPELPFEIGVMNWREGR
jgi:hypothetical protein